MKLKQMQINNYRQFEKVQICYDDNLSILAGANNSGKTSLVELYRNLFDSTVSNIQAEDISIKKYCEDIQTLTTSIIKIFTDHSAKEERVKELDNFLSMKIFNEITVKLEVEYNESESITKFADYLMELSSDNKSFYFLYRYAFEIKLFKTNFSEKIEKISSHFEKYNGLIEKIKAESSDEIEKSAETVKNLLQEVLVSEIYNKSFEPKFFFTDKEYNNSIDIDAYKFKKLFHFKRIKADRNLADEKDNKTCFISNEFISLLAQNDTWKSLVKETPDKILKLLKESKIESGIKEYSEQCLVAITSEINKTKGCEIGEPYLELNVTDEHIENLILKSTKAKYKFGGDICFNEQAQGLGYSNLIYIHIQLEKFKTEYEETLVNFFVVEEPESHMHPHMQRILIKYLEDYFTDKKVQGMITTHSNEIVKKSELNKIRVIRTKEYPLINEIYDMNLFWQLLQNEEKKKFYQLLFQINYSDLFFAHKIIMYEGDTEKMFLEKILNLEKYSNLQEQYISFIQVGGAYAHKYKELVEFLNIKTLIFTDIDYKKTKTSIDDIKSSISYNECLKEFYKESIETQDSSTEISITVGNLYQWNQTSTLIRLEFQKENDGASRTLEEAILSKYLNMNISNEQNKAFWETQKKNTGLVFSIPQKDIARQPINNKIKIRDIVRATSDNKTDFMYSLLLNQADSIDSFVPNYVEEGLNWLAQ